METDFSKLSNYHKVERFIQNLGPVTRDQIHEFIITCLKVCKYAMICWLQRLLKKLMVGIALKQKIEKDDIKIVKL